MKDMNNETQAPEKKAPVNRKKVFAVLAIMLAAILVLGTVLFIITGKLLLAIIVGVVITGVFAMGIAMIRSNLAKLKLAKEKNIDGLRVGALKDLTMSLFAIVAALFICYVAVSINIPKP